MTNRWVMILLATAGGLGLLPVMPGTWGTLGGVAIHFAGYILCSAPPSELVFLISALIIVFLVGILVIPWSCKYWRQEDPKKFVLDEVVGYLITIITLKVLLEEPLNFIELAFSAFVTFRFFDVIKLPGARWMDRQKGIMPIMLDDVISGFYAAATLWLFLKLRS